MSTAVPIAVQGERPPSPGADLLSIDTSAGPPLPCDTPTFEILFLTYHARLCSFASRYVGCPDTAEEVVEEVFLRIWAQHGADDDRCGCSQRYLYTAVRNQALKVLDHERVVQRSHGIVIRQEHVPGMSQPLIAADERLQAEELTDAVRHAIDQLPERCRQAYVLHRQQGMSYAEVAEVMGISVRTVETQLSRAAKSLRQALAAWRT
jgi:RNA polymerase sigma-70 factor (ECF subfamily)